MGDGLDRGGLLVAALVLVWPLGATAAVVVRRPHPSVRWRPFRAAAVVGLAVTGLSALAAALLFARGGTSAAMGSLGYQIVAACTLLGAVSSALVALALWLTYGRERVESDR